jgi:hypothetical protein
LRFLFRVLSFSFPRFNLIFKISFMIIVVVVVLRAHCDIYQSFYNISELNLPPTSFILLHPHSWNGFNKSHFSIFIHEQIIFLPYSPSYTLFFYLTLSDWCQPPDRACVTLLISVFEKRYKMAIQGVSLWGFCVYVYYNPNWFIPLFFSFLP